MEERCILVDSLLSLEHSTKELNCIKVLFGHGFWRSEAKGRGTMREGNVHLFVTHGMGYSACPSVPSHFSSFFHCNSETGAGSSQLESGANRANSTPCNTTESTEQSRSQSTSSTPTFLILLIRERSPRHLDTATLIV